MKIIAESPHSWQKKIIIHANSFIILYILYIDGYVWEIIDRKIPS